VESVRKTALQLYCMRLLFTGVVGGQHYSWATFWGGDYSSTRNERVHSLCEGGYAALTKLLGGTGV